MNAGKIPTELWDLADEVIDSLDPNSLQDLPGEQIFNS